MKGAMLCVNIMVNSSDLLKTPSQSFFPIDHTARTVEEGAGGELVTDLGTMRSRAIETNKHKTYPFFLKKWGVGGVVGFNTFSKYKMVHHS